MAKYRAKTACYGFRKKFWRAGEETDVSDPKAEKLPKHFERVGKLTKQYVSREVSASRL